MTAPRTLLVSTPLLHGPDVLAVQEKLHALGYNPGALDSKYGPSTAAALKAFQKARKLQVDGIDGPKTVAALAAAKPKPAPKAPAKPKPPAKAPAKPAKQSPGLLALTWMVGHLGETESPAGSNLTEFGKWAGINGVPWCNIVASEAFYVGAGVQLCKGYSAAGVFSKGCAYVPTTEAWLRLKHIWLGRVLPEDGDLEIFNWDGGDPDHIGLGATEATLRRLVPHKLDAAITAYGPLGPGQYWSVEGNTAVGNESNGGQVMLRKRGLTDIDGIGRIK